MKTKSMIWMGVGALAVGVQAQPAAMPGAAAGHPPVEQRRLEVRQAVEARQIGREAAAVAERRLSEHERAELREQLRLSAQRREDGGARWGHR